LTPPNRWLTLLRSTPIAWKFSRKIGKGSIPYGSTGSGGFVSGGGRMILAHPMLRLLIITNERIKTMARTPIHPGEILGDELEEVGLSAKRLAEAIEVPPNRLYQILSGKRSMTADTALRLGRYFGMTPDFWMNLQSAYELDLARQQVGKEIERVPRRNESVAEGSALT
jgi:addiction module HigA family antidote